MEPPKKPEPEHRLAGVQFMPGVAVSVGGKWTALMYWDRVKYCDQSAVEHRILAEELKNGDLRLSTADGYVRVVHPWAIAWKLYEPVRGK